MGIRVRIGPSLAAAVLTAALAGCGASSGSLLSAASAGQLKADLDQAQSAVGHNDCPAAQAAINRFRSDVAQLQGVDATLVSMLSQGASTVEALVTRRCGNAVATTTTTATHTTATPSTTSPALTVTTVTTASTPTQPAPATTTGSSSGGAPPTPATTATVSVPATTTTAPAPPASGGTGLNAGANGNGNGVGG